MATAKTLVIQPEKCNGCGDCESACSSRQAAPGKSGRSCIRIVTEADDGTFWLPMTCQQCDDPPCRAACPNEAISRDDSLGRVVIDRRKCVGCRMCVSACPFGAMGFDERSAKAFKCDLCGGEPECVRACARKALGYDGPHMLQQPQMLHSAAKIVHLMRLMVF